MRAYASAKRAVERTTDGAARLRLTQSWPLAALAQQIEYEIVDESLRRG